MIEISDLEVSNIIFERGGNLFLFKHQTLYPAVLQNSVFQDVYFGGLELEWFNQVNSDYTTKLDVYNMTANSFDGNSKSFIQVKNGADLRIYESRFTQ